MFKWLDDDLEQLRAAGLHRERRRLQSAQGTHVRLHGRELVNFASNDYLGYAADPRLARAAARAAKLHGVGAGASALVSGWSPPLRALERDLARWEGAEAALVLTSGFAANLALVGSVADGEDAVFSDAANHASLIDGCRLSRASIHVYGHADLGHVEELLRAQGPRARRRFIVTDTVFSMGGDLAPLPGLLELAERFDAVLLADEAHATGVLGKNGTGAVEMLLPSRPDRVVKVGTLSKALGCQGGFVSGPRSLIDWLVNRARPYVFSTALAPALAGAARCAVALVRREPERRQHLLHIAEMLRATLRRGGVDLAASSCHIIPVVAGKPAAALAWSRRLEENGFLVPAIRPPSVAAGSSRLRISLTAGHTEADVAALADAVLHLP